MKIGTVKLSRKRCEATLQSMLTPITLPPSDIPPQARDDVSTQPVRLIPDSKPPQFRLVFGLSRPSARQLSRGNLRAVSPLHLQYLQNLGVAASTSIAVFQDQKLWGLLACHNSKPLVIQPRQRLLTLRLVEYASERLWLIHSRQWNVICDASTMLVRH